jgi:hypothetical protein
MEDKIEAARVCREHKRIARKIEEVFQRSYRGKDAYSKGQFCKDDFFCGQTMLLWF